MSAAAGPAAEALSWTSVLHAGLCRLRLAPELFWRPTPVELAAAIGAFAPETTAPARGDLAALMAAFPDEAASGQVDEAAPPPTFTGEWQ